VAGREAHEQHRACGDLLGPGDAQPFTDQLRHVASGETAPDRGHRHQVTDVHVLRGDAVEQLLARLEEHPDGVLDVFAIVAFEVEADLVAFEDEIVRVHREPDAVDQRPFVLASLEGGLRHVRVGQLGGDPPPEVRQAVGDLDEDATRLQRVDVLHLGQCLLQPALGGAQRLAIVGGEREPSGHDRVPERHHGHRNVVVQLVGDAGKLVLGRGRRLRGPLRVVDDLRPVERLGHDRSPPCVPLVSLPSSEDRYKRS
jgi:hypothetical protein